MLLASLLGVLGCTPTETKSPNGISFALAPADLGTARAAATGFDPADGDATGLALDQVLPVFGNPVPLWEAPLFVLELLRRDNVRSEGDCPFERIQEDGATLYEGDCRSSYGYEFAGDLAEHEWTEDGVDRHRIEADVEVEGDVDDPLFERVVLQGAMERAVPEDGSIDAHYDVNLRLEVLGYWESRPGEEARATAWTEWVVSGTAEEVDGRWAVDLAAEVGGAGGMTVASGALTESGSCPIELDGEALLGEGITATFAAASCDACADVAHADGETTACGR